MFQELISTNATKILNNFNPNFRRKNAEFYLYFSYSVLAKVFFYIALDHKLFVYYLKLNKIIVFKSKFLGDYFIHK